MQVIHFISASSQFSLEPEEDQIQRERERERICQEREREEREASTRVVQILFVNQSKINGKQPT